MYIDALYVLKYIVTAHCSMYIITTVCSYVVCIATFFLYKPLYSYALNCLHKSCAHLKHLFYFYTIYIRI